MSTVMATDRGYGRGDGRVYGDKDYDYEYDMDTDSGTGLEQREFSRRRHHDGDGGGGSEMRMRVADRKYSPVHGGFGDGGYWDEPPEELRRDYGRHGEFDIPRMQGLEEERRVGDADGRRICKPASSLRGDSNGLCDIVDEKHLPCHEDSKCKRPKIMGSGLEYMVERCVSDGHYMREPMSSLRSDLDRLCDIVDGKHLPGLEDGEFKRPRTMGPGPEKEVERCIIDGRYMREPVSRLRREYDIHEDGEFKRPRTMSPGPEEELERCVGDAKYLHQPSQEMLQRAHNRHSEIVEGKYSFGCEACTFERPRGRYMGEEKRYLRLGADAGVSDGGYLHEPSQEGFRRDRDKYSDTVDRWEDYDDGIMRRYHGYGDEDDNSREEKCSLKCCGFNDELSRVNSTPLKFQGNHLLHEHGKSDDSKISGGGAGVGRKRNYLGQQYGDTCQSQQLIHTNSSRMEAGKEKLCTFSDPFVVSVRPKGYAILRGGGGGGDGDGGRNGMTSPYPHTSLHKSEDHHLPQGQPFRREIFGEDNPFCYSKDKYYEQSSTCPKAFPPGSCFGFKEEFAMSRQGLQAHSDGVGLSSMTMSNPMGYDGYGEKLPIKSPVDPVGLSSDVRSYSQAFLEKHWDYTYPDMGRRDADYIVAGSQDIHGGTIDAGEENGHLDVQRTRGMNPIADEMDQISRRDHFRDSRPWENDPYLQGQANPKYAHAAGSPHVRKHDLDVFGYGDAPLHYEIRVYKDSESDQPEGPQGYEIDYDILFRHSDNSSLPEHISERPSLSSGRGARKIFGELYADELNTYGELHPMVVSKKSKFSSPKHGNTERRIGGVSSQLTSQELSQSTSSVLSNSQKSTRGIKARLGPRFQDVHVSDCNIKNRGSVKSRLGPRLQNLRVSHPKIKKNRSSVKSRLGPAH